MTKLTDVCDIQYGYAFDSRCFSDDETYLPLIRIRDVKRGYSETFYNGDYPEEYIVHTGDLLVGMDGEFNIARWKSRDALLNQRVCKIVEKKGVNGEYIRFFLSRALKEIENRTAFVTVKHLSAKELNRIELNLPSIEKQKKIAESLCKMENIITHRRTQLEKLDLLVKARFVEMFGEVGTDKFGWGLQKIGDICEINPKKAKESKLHSELKISFVPMPAVSEYGNIDATEIKTYEEVKSGFTYFAENDVLFAKITPCMENGKGCIARGLCNGIGFGSTEFHVIRPTAKTNPYWIYNVTVFKQFRKDAAANMTGSAGQRRVPAKFLENYKVALPPIELQTQFADFVKQVDKSKATVQKALDEAQLLFDSLMQEYFG
nr:restriction endonuclease subunit S [uncultured Ruminococcus sp.]